MANFRAKATSQIEYPTSGGIKQSTRGIGGGWPASEMIKGPDFDSKMAFVVDNTTTRLLAASPVVAYGGLGWQWLRTARRTAQSQRRTELITGQSLHRARDVDSRWVLQR